MSKYVNDTLYDGMWKVIGFRKNEKNHYFYIFENIYNGRKVEVYENSMRRIARGQYTISKYIRHCIFREKRQRRICY